MNGELANNVAAEVGAVGRAEVGEVLSSVFGLESESELASIGSSRARYGKKRGGAAEKYV